MAGKKTATDYAKTINDAIQTAPFKVLLTVRSGEEDKIHDWLGVDKSDTNWSDPENHLRFSSVCESVWGYWVEPFYGSDMKDQIQTKAISPDDFVSGLHEEMVKEVVESLKKLAESLDGDEGSRVETVATELAEQFEAIKKTVRETISASHIEMEDDSADSGSKAGRVAKTGEASAAGENWQPGGLGYKKFKYEYEDSTAHLKATWIFGLRAVTDDEKDYHLPSEGDESDAKYHWQLVEGEPIIVQVTGYPEKYNEKSTNAAEDFTIDDRERTNFEKEVDWVEGIIRKWPNQEWYPPPGPPAKEGATPDEFKVQVEQEDADGYKWKFYVSWVNEDESAYLPDDYTGDLARHLCVPSGQTVVVESEEDELSHEVTNDRWLAEVGTEKGEPTNIAAIAALFEDGRGAKWYPREPPTTEPVPDTHKIRVAGIVKDAYAWAFSVAYTDKDEKIYVKKDSKKPDKQLVIGIGEKISVSHASGEGDPKETTTAKMYSLGAITEDDGDAAVEKLLEDTEIPWFPAAASVQAEQKAGAKAVEDATKALTAVQTEFGKGKQFIQAWLRRAKPPMPQPEQQAFITELETFVTTSSGIEIAREHLDQLKNVVKGGRELVASIEGKAGKAAQLSKLTQWCDQLDEALDKAFPET